MTTTVWQAPSPIIWPMEGGGEGSVCPDPEPLGFIYWERRLTP